MVECENNLTSALAGEQKIELVGLTWDDPRGYGPLPAAEEAYRDAYPECRLSVHWDVQPLSGFESRPLAEVAARYDLLVMDHPHTLDGARSGYLLPVGELADEYVGNTCKSYQFGGQQWAVPIDAACHVAAYATQRVRYPFETWDEVIDAADNGLRVAAPLSGVHSLMALLTVLESTGVEVKADFQWCDVPEVESSLVILRRLVDVGLKEGLDWNPIDALHALSADCCDYLPVTFGYAHLCGGEVRCSSVPAVRAGAAARGVLGGAGLAVSAHCDHPDEAVKFARFLAASRTQTECWSRFGGQPAHRDAWRRLARMHPFYRDTTPAIETAFIRPRAPDWNRIQSKAGQAIEYWLRSGQQNCQNIMGQLMQVWRPRSM